MRDKTFATVGVVAAVGSLVAFAGSSNDPGFIRVASLVLGCVILLVIWFGKPH